MKPENILQADVLDIIFEHRNKEYGAYMLRKDYNRRLRAGILSMLSLVILFALFTFGSASKPKPSLPVPVADDARIVEVPTYQPPPNQKKVPAASLAYSTPKIVKESTDTFPEIKQLAQEVQISTFTQDGPPPTNEAPTIEAQNATTLETPVELPEPEILSEAEVPPMFPGGIAALRRYLLKNLRFDFDDQEPGTRIEIKCRFVVDKDGKVDAVQIVKSAGKDAYDKEVMRVVNRMPQWQAGKQKNKDVAVYFTLPVIVEVPEQ